MSFFKRLSKLVRKGAALYGKVGIGPGSGLAAKFTSYADRASALKRGLKGGGRRATFSPGLSCRAPKIGHNRRTLMRSQGIPHGRAKVYQMHAGRRRAYG